MQAPVGDRFVGRAALLAQLDECLAGAALGRGSLVVLAGEPGIGKTRLAQECARRASERGFTLAWSACWEEGGAPGFWPWTQLVQAVLASDPDLTTALGAASRLTDLGTEYDADRDPELARFALFDAVVAFLRTVARPRPLVLVIDDLHWADVPSLSLLGFVSRHLPALPVMIVATCREGAAVTAQERRWFDELLRHGRWLVLGGLADAEVADLVSGLTGKPVEPVVLGDLQERTGGNPLFVTEIARVARAQRTDMAQVPVPDSIRALQRRRLDRLSADARELLTMAAVVGSRFRLDFLAAVAGIDTSQALALLDEPAEHGLVREEALGAYAFTHALVRDALYLDLGFARRVRLHERVAEALAQRASSGVGVDPAELAHHFANAAPGGHAAEALPYLRAAADRAMRMLAYEEATRHYATALGLVDVAPAAADRVDLLLSLGAAKTAAGDREGAREAHLAAAEGARAKDETEQLAAAALGLGGGKTGFEVTLFDRQQVALLEEALAGLDETSPLRTVVLARLSVALSLDAPVEQRVDLSRQAVILAEDRGDQAALAYALAAHCDAIAGPADAEARRDAAAEIVTLAAELGDARLELLGRRLAVVALLELGDLGGADAQVIAYGRLAASLRQPLFGWYVPLWRGMQALVAGWVAEAGGWLARAEAEGKRAGSANAAMLTNVLKRRLLTETARWKDQLAALADVAEVFAADDRAVQIGLALADAQAGRLDEARQRLTRVGVEGLAAASVDSEWLSMIAEATQAVGLLGGHPTADWLYAALLPHHHRFVVDGIGAYCPGSAERFCGILAAALERPDKAWAHFDAALASNESAGMSLAVAATLRDGAISLADPAWYRRAIDAYRALSIEPQVADLAGRLEALGAPVPTARSSAPSGEFICEGEYWRLAWAGRTVRVKESKGMGDLALLLSRPGREVPALDLIGAPGGSDLGEVVDAQARAAYQARLAELESEIDDADRIGDVERSARAVAERDALVEQLTTAYGLGGRPRRAGDPAERARSTVSHRIRDAIRRIEAAHPDLGKHLRRAVRTGRYVAYDPEQPASWTTR